MSDSVPASDAISAAYDRRFSLLQRLAEVLETTLQTELEHTPHIDRCTFRAKSPSRFLVKANNPQYTHPLAEIEDQVVGRVLVHLLSDLQPVADVVEQLWGAVEVRRVEPENARQFDYESWHYIVVIPEHSKPEGWETLSDMPTTFELQIRTLFMHAYAEPQHDWAYQANRDLSRDETRHLAWVAAAAWGADRSFAEIYGQLTSPSRGNELGH